MGGGPWLGLTLHVTKRTGSQILQSNDRKDNKKINKRNMTYSVENTNRCRGDATRHAGGKRLLTGSKLEVTEMCSSEGKVAPLFLSSEMFRSGIRSIFR